MELPTIKIIVKHIEVEPRILSDTGHAKILEQFKHYDMTHPICSLNNRLDEKCDPNDELR